MTTISEIARAAGVSKVTVSNILNGRYKENRPSAIRRAEQVRQIAEQVGYRPNAAARAITQGRHGNLALLFSENIHRGSQFRGTMRSIMQTAREHRQRLMFTGLPDEVLTDEHELADALRDLSADGLLVQYIQDIPDGMPELLARFRIPAVWLNTRREADCVFPNDFAAARDATRRLIALGHRRIAYLNPTPYLHYSNPDRMAGYEAAMSEVGLPPAALIGPAYWKGETPLAMGEWQDVCRRWLSAPAGERPTAVVCYDGPRAYTLYSAALAVGLVVPRDLSLVTFEELPADQVGVEVTTSLIPAEEIGREAVRRLLQKIADPTLALPPLAVPHGWHRGATLAPPP